MVSNREIVDEEFGPGVFEQVYKGAAADVRTCLAGDELLEAGFSAAHFMILQGEPVLVDGPE